MPSLPLNKPHPVVFDLSNHKISSCIATEFFETDEPVFVIICAALSQIDRCLIEKDVSYKINVEGTNIN